jgi:hypothetical protein
VESLFSHATELFDKQVEIDKETQEQVKEMHQSGDELPTLD